MIASLISLALILTCSSLFYEVLAHVWVRLPKIEGRPRLQIVFTIFATFFGHTLCIWIFGVTYYLLDKLFHFGTLGGNITHELLEYVYFSSVSYSSLGLGDVYPTGGLQLLVGVEAILGLVLIGWSVTFTYLVTEKYLFHRRTP
ncbi:MAG: ion channel [Alphaproteobacteria bacterium]|nr:ion channel [Alphaproteobacteria bacterium]